MTVRSVVLAFVLYCDVHDPMQPAKCILYYCLLCHRSHRYVLILVSIVAARDEAVKIRHFVKKSQAVRTWRGPEPSQRAPNSVEAVCRALPSSLDAADAVLILQLIAYAENTEICRHVVSMRRLRE